MKKNSSGWRWIIGLTVVFTALNACSNEQSDQKGNAGMFGLFGNKTVKPGTSVAGQVGATLQRHDSVPSQLPPAAVPSFPECRLAHIRGNPPEAQWVPEEVLGETRRVFRIPAAAGEVPLAVLASASRGGVSSFAKLRRVVALVSECRH